ncbi:MAG: O-antigen ligase family protein [Acidobacteriia bacterium]|nr:O-antigen ligase family protein [Terriglobia bacterium]
METSNQKFENGSGRGASSSPWQVLLFVTLGSLGFLAILKLADIVEKHSYKYKYHGYKELVLIALMAGGALGLIYFYKTFREAWPAALETIRSLRWYHWLWTVIFISGLVFRKRTAAEGMDAPVDNAALFRICAVGSVGATLLCQMFLRKIEWLRSVFTGLIGLLIWFDLMALLSTIWSVYWEWTFYKAVEYGVDVCLLGTIIYVIRSSKAFKVFADWTWILYGIMLVNVWLGCIWDPNDALLKGGAYGVQGIGGLGVWLQGVFPDVSSNQLAEYAACISVVGLCRLLPMSRKRENVAWYWFVFLFGFVTMIFGQTRSAVGGFCVAVFLIFLLSSRVAQGAAIVISSCFLIIVTGFYEYLWDYLKRGQSENQLESFSSRLEWWEVALQKFANYPFTGLGMWAAARFGVLAKIGYTQTATVHSDWVEIIVGTGAWGFVPVLILIFMAWWILIKCMRNDKLDMNDRQLAYEGMAVLAVVFCRMFFMTDLSLHPPCHFFVALGTAEFLRRKLKKPQAYEQNYAPAQLSASAGV